ncbi:MAG: SMC-Scp complex subunit ScpB [Fuerstia sp.]|nr:SMC-Scp complex subunit ScpB [Fuerstiella sp.]
MPCRNRQSADTHPGQTQQPQREKLRWLDRSFRTRRSALAALQILPDGGLIRSTRIARMEAALLIADGAVPARKLTQVARLIDVKEVQQFVQVLNESYDRTRSAFRIEQTAAGYILMTRAALSPWLDRLHNRQAELKLSSPMMETLTIIAYQQPVTRADVEAIRGVQAAEMIRQLMDRSLVRIGGEDDSLGRPFLYITTQQFLTLYGLYRLEDLPNYATLRRQRSLPAIAEVGDNEDVDLDEAA